MTDSIEVGLLRIGAAPGLMELAKRMWAESRFNKLPFSSVKTADLIQEVIKQKPYLAVGSYDGDKLCGMCIGVCGDILPFTGSMVATQHFLYLDEDYRRSRVAYRMVRSFVEEAKFRGAEDVVFSNGYGGDPAAVERLYSMAGLVRIGSIYTLGD